MTVTLICYSYDIRESLKPETTPAEDILEGLTWTKEVQVDMCERAMEIEFYPFKKVGVPLTRGSIISSECIIKYFTSHVCSASGQSHSTPPFLSGQVCAPKHCSHDAWGVSFLLTSDNKE